MSTITLSSILESVSTPVEFNQWLTKVGIQDVEDFALMAAAEERVKEDIILAAAEAHVYTKKPRIRVSITKAWRAARKFPKQRVCKGPIYCF